MFKYQIFDYKHNLLIQTCSSLEEAISIAKPLIHSKKIKIKKIEKDLVVREFSFIFQEGKDVLISYIDANGLVISSPI